MVKLLLVSLLRSIKKTFGRFIAILAIIFLGVGFFSGIKSAKPAMAKAADSLFYDCNMYDYTLQSTLGLTEDDVKAFDDQSLHKGGKAQGGYNFHQVGFFSTDSNGNIVSENNTKDLVFNTYSYSYSHTLCDDLGNDLKDDSGNVIKMEEMTIAKPIVKYGRYIQNKNECLLDDQHYSEKDIGKTITFKDCKSVQTIDNERDSETKSSSYTGLVADCDAKIDSESKSDNLKEDSASFKVVGIVQSPLYISKERGNTSLLLGKIDSFIYLPKDRYYLYQHDPASKDTKAINSPRNYTEILYSIGISSSRFSDDYDTILNKYRTRLENLLDERVQLRYNDLFKEAIQGKQTLETSIKTLQDFYDTLDDSSQYKSQIKTQIDNLTKQLDELNEKIEKLPTAKGFALSLKESNESYINFNTQIQIISTVADAFPIFFAIIAALVCITTMKRMVSDERGEIATWKAMGYSNSLISLKYILYSTTAALIGSLLGYFLMTLLIPQLGWMVYSANFVLGRKIPYYFSPLMFILCLLVAVVGSFLFTYLPCLGELVAKPAEGMRPKAPKAGKKMFVEKHMPKLWSKLSFMSKCIVKNVIRYKERLIMFIVGIAGCTMLIVMGFGFNDSIANMGVYQYQEIQKYDAMVSYIDQVDTSDDTIATLEDGCLDYTLSFTKKLSFSKNGRSFDANIVQMDENEGLKYVSLHTGKKKMYNYPKEGECVISKGIQQNKGVKVADTIDVSINGIPISYKVVAICDNYLDHYVYVSSLNDVDVLKNTIYLNLKPDLDNDDAKAHDYYTKLRGCSGIANISVSKDIEKMIQKTFDSLSIVIVFIIFLSGALAFIVLYNLTNINIIERTREIATIQVLGFNKRETGAYVLRENIILSVFGSLLGLPLGKLMHFFIMSQIHLPDTIFDIRISPWSYLISFTITIVFTILSNLIMKVKLSKINMAESLKSVD